jgi:hypothetical protein
MFAQVIVGLGDDRESSGGLRRTPAPAAVKTVIEVTE